MTSRPLWNKFWLETRWRFISGIAILTVLAGGQVVEWVATSRFLLQIDPSVVESYTSGPMGAAIREAMELQSSFRGFIWYNAFRDNLASGGTFFAILLGCGGLLSESSKGSALFTLSLPVTRRALFAARTGVGLAQCLVIAVVPPLLIPLMAPAIGQQFGVVDALAHGVCLFVVGALFFGLATYLSTFFADTWRPLVIALMIACVALVGSYAVPQIDVFSVMNGATYFRTGSMPWTGLLTSAVVATALLYSASESLERRDF